MHQNKELRTTVPSPSPPLPSPPLPTPGQLGLIAADQTCLSQSPHMPPPSETLRGACVRACVCVHLPNPSPAVPKGAENRTSSRRFMTALTGEARCDVVWQWWRGRGKGRGGGGATGGGGECILPLPYPLSPPSDPHPRVCTGKSSGALHSLGVLLVCWTYVCEDLFALLLTAPPTPPGTV